MLLGKADTLLAERARMALADALAPIYAVLAPPIAALRDTIGGATDLWDIRAENARLRDENEQLRQWQSIALALDAENQRLKANLHWIPDAARHLRHRPRGGRCRRGLCQGGAALGRAEPRHPQGPDRARRARPGRPHHRGGRAHRAGAADHRPQQPHPGDPGELPRARHPGRHQRAAAAAAVLAGRQHAAGRASGSSPAPRRVRSRPTCRSAPCISAAPTCPRWSRRRCSTGWRWCASSTTAWPASWRRTPLARLPERR